MGNVNLRNPRGWRTGLAGILLLAASAVSAAEKITYYHLAAEIGRFSIVSTGFENGALRIRFRVIPPEGAAV